jgi:hypothetical protein
VVFDSAIHLYLAASGMSIPSDLVA